jgi:hypothetical protein
MKKGRGLLKSFPVMPVALVAGFAAALFFGYNYLNARRAATGKNPIGSVAFSVALLVAGAVSMMFKRVKVVSAPLLMVGATLLGFEAVKKIGMSGPALRYRFGQARPAAALQRPAAAMNRAASSADGPGRVPAGGAAWGSRRSRF